MLARNDCSGSGRNDEGNRQLDQQAEALGKIGQALDRQGEALAELLRRTA